MRHNPHISVGRYFSGVVKGSKIDSLVEKRKKKGYIEERHIKAFALDEWNIAAYLYFANVNKKNA